MNEKQAKQKALEEVKKNGWLDVAKFADSLGVKVFATSDLEDYESGAIVRENDKYVIYVNETHTPERQRFTIAHELGHYFLHREKLQKEDHGIVDTIKIASGLPQLSRRDGVTTKQETQANAFAAELLMPEEIFKKIYKETNTIEEVAAHFRVSSEAAAVRAHTIFRNKK